jgi:hypothetical protein
MTLPVAHIGHYLWVFYLLPVIFVIAGILKTTLSERRATRAKSASQKGHELSAPNASAENPETGSPPPVGGTSGDAENEDLARRHPRS